jgi:hypothetical protein
MNRRSFIQSLAAALAGAGLLKGSEILPEALIPEVIPTATPFPVTLKRAFRIIFPDGTTYAFQGVIEAVAHNAPVDDLVSFDFSVRPTGRMEITKSLSNERGEWLMDGAHDIHTHGTVIVGPDGEELGEVKEISMPHIEHTVQYLDGTNEFVPGIRQIGSIGISVFPTDEDAFSKVVKEMQRGPDITVPMKWEPNDDE